MGTDVIAIVLSQACMGRISLLLLETEGKAQGSAKDVLCVLVICIIGLCHTAFDHKQILRDLTTFEHN